MVEDATHSVVIPCPLRLLVLLGTRPEAVKLAPLVLAARSRPDVAVELVSSGQHPRDMLEALGEFGLRIDKSVDLYSEGRTIAEIMSGELVGLARELEVGRPHAVVVQGDTTTAFAGALASFYAEIPVAHVEAGLRTNDRAEPFPEEMNRRLIDHVAAYRFPPTWSAADNLAAEGLGGPESFVTGNTIVDALCLLLSGANPHLNGWTSQFLDARWVGRLIVTAHRRESWGEPMTEIARALGALATRFPGHVMLLPLHPNPIVRRAFTERPLPSNVLLADPLPYPEFIAALRHSDLVVTDSGGVLEEATALGRPVLIMRRRTERPEAVAAGAAQVIGIDGEKIEAVVARALAARRVRTPPTDVFGDGCASERIVDWLRWRYGLTVVRPEPYVPNGAAVDAPALLATG